MHFTQVINELTGGISTAPDTKRLASQLSSVVNCNLVLGTGITRRNGTRTVTQIKSGTNPITDMFASLVSVGGEKVIVEIDNATLRVLDLDGGIRTVTVLDSDNYLTLPTGIRTQDAFRCVAVGDYVIIANNTKTCAMTSATSAAWPKNALVWVKAGNYSCDYVIKANGVQISSYTTPNGSVATDRDLIKTNYIVLQLIANLTDSNYVFTAYGSTIKVSRVDTADFEILCTDSQGDQSMVAFKGQTQKFSDLPKRGFNGFSIEIKGDRAASDEEAYAVTYTATSNSDGVWKETVYPGLQTTIDKTTMPHVLVRQPDGTFTFGQQDWGQRLCGSETTNPLPGFIGATIRDLGYFKNRICLAYGETLSFSEDGEPFNYFRTSTVDLLDADSIEVAVGSKQVREIDHILQFDQDLYGFAEGAQFRVYADGPLFTAKTVTVNLVTTYPHDTSVAPVLSGRMIYFPSRYGSAVTIQEYVLGEDSIIDAAPINLHCSGYPPGFPEQLVADPASATLLVRQRDLPSRIYLYQSRWNGTQKIQSAWHEWRIEGGNILWAGIDIDRVWLITEYPDGAYLEFVSLSPYYTEGNGASAWCLDRCIHLSSSLAEVGYDEEYEASYVYGPWSSSNLKPDVIFITDGGHRVTPEWWEYNDGRWSAWWSRRIDTGLWAGLRYESFFEFPRLYPVNPETQTIVVNDDKIIVSSLTLEFVRTGFLEISCEGKGRSRYAATFADNIPADGYSFVNPLPDGSLTISVRMRNTECLISARSEHWLSFVVTSGSWKGEAMTRKGKVQS